MNLETLEYPPLTEDIEEAKNQFETILDLKNLQKSKIIEN